MQLSLLHPHGVWGSGKHLTHRHDRDVAGQRAPRDIVDLAELTAPIAAADAVLLLGRIAAVETVEARGIRPAGDCSPLPTGTWQPAKAPCLCGARGGDPAALSGVA